MIGKITFTYILKCYAFIYYFHAFSLLLAILIPVLYGPMMIGLFIFLADFEFKKKPLLLAKYSNGLNESLDLVQEEIAKEEEKDDKTEDILII